MVRFKNSRKKEIALKRFRFFYQEIFLGFILIFVFSLIAIFLVPLIIYEESTLYGIIFYSIRAILVLLGITLMFPLSNLIFESQKGNIMMEEDISSAMGHLRLYKMTKKNYKYQFLYGLLIFFLIFLPIDFFTYLLIPDMLEYQARALGSRTPNLYLSENNYLIFLISVIIIQFSVAIAEETVSRGFIAKRGSEHFFNMSAVFISAIYFGLGHLGYLFDHRSIELLSGKSFPIYYSFIWFLQAIFIGIILSLVVLRRKWLFPVIIAHTLNNIVSAHAVWSFWQGVNFSLVALYIYYPLLIIGFCLFVWFYPLIKESLSIGSKMLKSYFNRDEPDESTKGDSIFRVFFDFCMGLMIFLIGFMIAV